jgi:hypothetical protein
MDRVHQHIHILKPRAFELDSMCMPVPGMNEQGRETWTKEGACKRAPPCNIQDRHWGQGQILPSRPLA